MNSLPVINKMASMEIAEVTGKRHADIMRDIRDEIEKLVIGGISNERKFALVEYIDAKGEKRPCYELTKEGVLQLAARYDAVVRAKLIELVMQQERSFYQGLSKELQAIIMHDKKIQAVETRVEKLENTMTVDYSQQECLRELANRVVINALGGKSSSAYKMISGRAFAELWRHYKHVMQVNSYKNTPVVDFDKAKDIILTWKPDQDLELMIVGANTQARIV